MARVLRGQPRVQRSKRLVAWGFGPDILNQLVTASTKLLGSTSIVLVSPPATLVRVRGYVHLGLETTSAVSSGFAGAVGLALVNDDAFSQGINSLPGPFSDPNYSWIWHSFFDVRSLTATHADAVNAPGMDQRLDLDSKAMRKWNGTQTLILMLEASETGASNLRVNADSRILIMDG